MTNEIVKAVEAVEAVEVEAIEAAEVPLNGALSLTFNFTAAGIVEQIPLGTLPQESIVALLQYGTRKGNDYVNSAFKAEQEKGGTKTRQDFANEWIAKLKAGTLGARTTSPQNEEEKAWRDFVALQAKRIGIQVKALKGLSATEIISQMTAKHPEKRDEVVAKLENAFEAVMAASKLDFEV